MNRWLVTESVSTTCPAWQANKVTQSLCPARHAVSTAGGVVTGQSTFTGFSKCHFNVQKNWIVLLFLSGSSYESVSLTVLCMMPRGKSPSFASVPSRRVSDPSWCQRGNRLESIACGLCNHPKHVGGKKKSESTSKLMLFRDAVHCSLIYLPTIPGRSLHNRMENKALKIFRPLFFKSRDLWITGHTWYISDDLEEPTFIWNMYNIT